MEWCNTEVLEVRGECHVVQDVYGGGQHGVEEHSSAPHNPLLCVQTCGSFHTRLMQLVRTLQVLRGRCTSSVISGSQAAAGLFLSPICCCSLTSNVNAALFAL